MGILKLDTVLSRTVDSVGSQGSPNRAVYVYPNIAAGVTMTLAKFQEGKGIIEPMAIQEDVDRLKFMVKRGGTSPLLGKAISLFEGYGGPIKLFDISNIDSTSAMLPTSVPFLPGRGKSNNTIGQSVARSSDDKPINAVFMNMARLGNWSPDSGRYENVVYNTDLLSVFVNGYIAYQSTFGGKMEAIYGNTAVAQNLAIIYCYLFLKTLKPTTQVALSSDADRDNVTYAVAEFFQRHSLGRPSGDSVDSIAYKCTSGRTRENAVKAYIDNLDLDYSSLPGFLETIGQAFYGTHIAESTFMERWLSMYGEGMLLASEWAPYLTYFLVATYHNARLDNICKLFRSRQEIQNLGQPLTKLYNALITVVG